MKWKFSDDENWLWKELGHSSFDVSALVRPGKEASDFQALETVLNHEIYRLTWWRRLGAVIAFLCIIVLINDSISSMWKSGWSWRSVFEIVRNTFLFWFFAFWMQFVSISNRWRHGVELAVRLSSSLSPNSAVNLLMMVLKWDEVRLGLNKKSLAPVLYHRLADVLIRVEDGKPDPNQRRLLQRIALSGRDAATNEQRYPDALRVAALLALADEPSALDEKFRARIATLTAQDATEDGVRAAAGEVLRRL